jgi:hypothetical protein
MMGTCAVQPGLNHYYNYHFTLSEIEGDPRRRQRPRSSPASAWLT